MSLILSTDIDLELSSIPVNIGLGCSLSLRSVFMKLGDSAPSNISIYSIRVP